jgi:feruloyl esterase
MRAGLTTGIGSGTRRSGNFTAPPNLDSGYVAFILQVPPENPATFNGPAFALTARSIDVLKDTGYNGTYTENSLQFETPPNRATCRH